jgi:hypothetical protein
MTPPKKKPEAAKKFPKKNPQMARDQSLAARKKNSQAKRSGKNV